MRGLGGTAVRLPLALQLIKSCEMRWFCKHRPNTGKDVSDCSGGGGGVGGGVGGGGGCVVLESKSGSLWKLSSSWEARGKASIYLTTYYSLREFSEQIRLETSVLFWLQICCWSEYFPQLLVTVSLLEFTAFTLLAAELLA